MVGKRRPDMLSPEPGPGGPGGRDHRRIDLPVAGDTVHVSLAKQKVVKPALRVDIVVLVVEHGRFRVVQAMVAALHVALQKPALDDPVDLPSQGLVIAGELS